MIGMQNYRNAVMGRQSMHLARTRDSAQYRGIWAGSTCVKRCAAVTKLNYYGRICDFSAFQDGVYGVAPYYVYRRDRKALLLRIRIDLTYVIAA